MSNQPKPTGEWFCNKCGYVGATQQHEGCNYDAAPIKPTGEWTVPEYHYCDDLRCELRCGDKAITTNWGTDFKNELYKIADAHNAALAAGEQSASDNADWFDQLCIDLRELLGMSKCDAPFEVSPILDEVRKLSKARARESERKSVHVWLNDINIPSEENGNRICLLRRLRITLDRFLNQQAALQPFIKIASEAKTNRSMLGTLTDEDFENLLSSDK